MMVRCKGCQIAAWQDFPTARSCHKFDDDGNMLPEFNDVWLCICCTDEVCKSCYMTHIESKHPELYSTPCLTCATVTLYKDFVEYGKCAPCKEKEKTA